MRYINEITQENIRDMEGYQIGRIIDVEKYKTVAIIVVDGVLLKESNMRDIAVYYGGDVELPIICVTEKFARKLQRNNYVACFSVFHELGHIVLKHDSNKESQEQIRRERCKAILAGSASEDEKAADAFSASIIGKELALKALKRLQVARNKYDCENGYDGTPNSIMAFLEYHARIEALRETEILQENE